MRGEGVEKEFKICEGGKKGVCERGGGKWVRKGEEEWKDG